MSLSDIGNIANLNNDADDTVTLDDLLLFVEDWCLEGVPLAGYLNRDSTVTSKILLYLRKTGNLQKFVAIIFITTVLLVTDPQTDEVQDPHLCKFYL
jgi:hypothetical protein